MNRSIIYIAAGNVQCSSIRFENVDVPQEITDTSPENVTTSPPSTTNCASHVRIDRRRS